jgi:hypothetical protein
MPTTKRRLGGKELDPAWRRDRSIKAVAGIRAAAEASRKLRGERFDTKGDAYAAGYRLGYSVALRRQIDRAVKAFGLRLTASQRTELLRRIA